MARDSEEARWEARQEYAEELAEQRRARKLNSCWCGLDGFPGHCPGPQHCPYSGFHDEDVEK